MGTHTDVLMGLPDRTMLEAELADEAERQRATRDAKDKLKAIQELLACSGWQVFKDYCNNEHLLLMRKLETTSDPTTLAKLVGVNLAVESFPLWPERYARELVEQIESP